VTSSSEEGTVPPGSSPRSFGSRATFPVRYPRRTILLAILLTVAAVPGLLRLKLRTDGNALVPPEAPEILTDRAIRREFGVKDQLVVVIETEDPKGIYNAHTLGLVRDLTERLQGLPGVASEDVISLASEKGAHTRPGTFEFLPYLEPFPEAEERQAWLRKRLGELPIYRGTLVSFDETSTAILIGVPDAQISEDAPSGIGPLRPDRSHFYREVQQILADVVEERDRILVTGAPVAETLLGKYVLEGLIALLPLAVLSMSLILYVAGRSLWAVILPMQEVAACLILTFGLMGWLGVPVYLTTAVLPVILTAIGVADEIHIFTRYRQKLSGDAGVDRIGALTTTMKEMTPPVVKTSVTSCVGFLSFALSPIQPVQMFGIFVAIGILFCMIWSLTVIPAALALIDPVHFRRRATAGPEPAPARSLGNAITRRILRGRVPALVCMAGLILLSPFGIRQLFVQDSWIDGLSPASEFRKLTDRVNTKFNGIHLLRLCWDAAPVDATGTIEQEAVDSHSALLPGDLVEEPRWLLHSRFQPDTTRSASFRILRAERAEAGIRIHTDPGEASMADSLTAGPGQMLAFRVAPARDRLLATEEIHRIKDFEEFLESREYAGGVIGTHEYLATANFVGTGHAPDSRRVDDSQYLRAERALHLLGWVLGSDRRREVMNLDNNRSLINVFLKNANFVQTRELLDAIRAYEREEITPRGVRLRLAGDVAVSQAMIPAIVRTQVASLLLSIVGIWLVSVLLNRSLLLSILVVLPAAFGLTILYAAMGFTRMPLGVATSMFGGMAIGLGVDYAVHLMERFRRCLGERLSVEAAITDAISTRGPAIALDALAVGVGFGILSLSQVPANRALGIVASLCIAACFVATLIGLPSLLCVLGPKLRRLAARNNK
jgi:predicted RND superfamily exporter protein